VATIARALRDRLLPAVLTAAGVTLIAAGLLNYSANVVAADPFASAAPDPVSAEPSTGLELPSLPPLDASPPPSGPAVSPTAAADRVATRVVVEQLGIDLPVIKPRGDSTTYPQCDVALYIQELSQPGNGRATYLYAHARDGMFGPIYERAIQKQHGGPRSMISMLVQVYTSDDLMFTYEVTEVRLHQLTLDDAIRATTEELWLQTSEGPKGTPGKTQLLAKLLISQPVDHAAAHPKAHPVTCA
jgi:hypothetical protein